MQKFHDEQNITLYLKTLAVTVPYEVILESEIEEKINNKKD